MRILKIFACVALTVTALCGCRSHRQAVAPELQTGVVPAIEEVESTVWTNVYSPVSVEILSPAQFSCSGRMTMVRGESIYLSLRMFGMEVGSAYSDPSQAVMSLRMPKKIMMEISVAGLLTQAGLSFTEVQEALMGNQDALSKLPPAVSYKAETDDSSSVVELHTVYAGKPLAVRLTWNLRSAKWNQDSPARWSAPGSDYSRITPSEALKMLGGFLK